MQQSKHYMWLDTTGPNLCNDCFTVVLVYCHLCCGLCHRMRANGFANIRFRIHDPFEGHGRAIWHYHRSQLLDAVYGMGGRGYTPC
jgi:hypothetical protein